MHGRLVQIGLLGSARAQINLSPIMQKRLTITGSTLRVRSVEEKGAIARELEERVWPVIAAGKVAPLVQRVIPLGQAAEAHRLLERGDVVGKVVLKPDHVLRAAC
jgi:NADPH:quinone reductase-like Zn-dependent oxidoreductase